MLVVEGYSDLRFYAEVLESLGRLSGVFIKEFGGRSDLEVKLEDFLRPDLVAAKEAIGVIVDANGDRDSIVARLERRLSVLTGQEVKQGGWTQGGPRIGLLVVGGAAGAGEVETLVWESWIADPANAVAHRCIESFVACMEQNAKLSPRSPEKGRLAALLAIRNDDDPRLGPGAQKKIFDFTRPELDRLCSFLGGLSQ